MITEPYLYKIYNIGGALVDTKTLYISGTTMSDITRQVVQITLELERIFKDTKRKFVIETCEEIVNATAR